MLLELLDLFDVLLPEVLALDDFELELAVALALLEFAGLALALLDVASLELAAAELLWAADAMAFFFSCSAFSSSRYSCTRLCASSSESHLISSAAILCAVPG